MQFRGSVAGVCRRADRKSGGRNQVKVEECVYAETDADAEQTP